MTISATTLRKSFTGDGSTTAFSFDKRFLANADLKVYQEGTLKTIATHYTVTGAGNSGGGTVTFVTAPALNDEIVIINDPSNTQSLDLVANDPFPAESLEAVLDRLTLQIQRCRDLIGRSVVLSDTDLASASTALPTPVSNNLLAWNLAATALQNVAPNSLGTLTIGAGSITDALLAPTLDLSGKTVALPAASHPGRLVNVQVFSANGTWTKPSGLSASAFCIVDAIGGGGGGAGAVAAGSQVSAGGGGGAGGHLFGKILAANMGATEAVVVGAGGGGGAGTGANGSDGVGTTITINGGTGTLSAGYGQGGFAMTSGTSVARQVGGGSTGPGNTGTLTGFTSLRQQAGDSGGTAFRFSSATGIAGKGGGQGGVPGALSGTTGGTGTMGIRTGSGGGGAISGDATGYAGGAGAAGNLIVYTYA